MQDPPTVMTGLMVLGTQALADEIKQVLVKDQKCFGDIKNMKLTRIYISKHKFFGLQIIKKEEEKQKNENKNETTKQTNEMST